MRTTDLSEGFPGGSDGEESTHNAGDRGLIPGLGDSWRKARLPTPVFLVFPGSSDGKASSHNVGDLCSI